ncbi:MAG: hypothetical protein HKO65_11430 [Gemmatimonadetes bacterium]|nr:hypothetical protein [Gemmatimonadota bacterium]NNM05688.1 hypothetical protein [Gemmatimonadota bacterium]
MRISLDLCGFSFVPLLFALLFPLGPPQNLAGQMAQPWADDTQPQVEMQQTGAPRFVVEANLLPAFFGYYELQFEKALHSSVGLRASLGIFDGLFEGTTMTSDYEAFGGSLGLRWYPSTSRPGFFVEGDIRADRLSWLLTFFPPTGPPGGSFPDRPNSVYQAAPGPMQALSQPPGGAPDPIDATDWSSSLDSMVGYRFFKGRLVFGVSAGVGLTLLAPDAEKGGEPPTFVKESESYQDFLEDFNGRYDTIELRAGLTIGVAFW